MERTDGRREKERDGDGKGKKEEGGRVGRKDDRKTIWINELISGGPRVISSFRPPSRWDYTSLTKCS